MRLTALRDRQHLLVSLAKKPLPSMRSSRTASSALSLDPTISIEPDGEHKATVVFLHGLGDTAHGWENGIQYIRTLDVQLRASVRWVLPTAPTRKVTLNGGMPMPAWYDIQTLSSRDDDPLEGIDWARDTLNGLIEQELQLVDSSKMVVGGFSQGAAVSLYSLYTRSSPVAGCLALSGYLPFATEFETLKRSFSGTYTPLLMCHGDSDPVVLPEWGERSYQLLEKFGVRGQWSVYRGMEHSACEEEMRDVAEWLRCSLGL